MMSGQQQEQQQATSSLPAHVVQSLVEKCVQAKTNAYAPYSNFRVGCALLTEDGQIYVGMCSFLCAALESERVSSMAGECMSKFGHAPSRRKTTTLWVFYCVVFSRKCFLLLASGDAV